MWRSWSVHCPGDNGGVDVLDSIQKAAPLCGDDTHRSARLCRPCPAALAHHARHVYTAHRPKRHGASPFPWPWCLQSPWVERVHGRVLEDGVCIPVCACVGVERASSVGWAGRVCRRLCAMAGWSSSRARASRKRMPHAGEAATAHHGGVQRAGRVAAGRGAP